MIKHISLIPCAALFTGMVMTGCLTTDTSPAPAQEIRAVQHNPIAHLSDLVALTNSLPGTRRVAYFTVELNDQTKQPFRGELFSSNLRRQFPMWTDVDLKWTYTDESGVIHEHCISTVQDGWYIRGIENEQKAVTNTPYISVEIPGTYKNSPDYRLNVRVDYVKYSSVANFLFANGMEGRIFPSLEAANAAYGNVKTQSEGYKCWDVFTQAPKTFVIKVDFGGLDPAVHNLNPKVNFSFNRRIGCMLRETGHVEGEGDKMIWTPVSPRWIQTGYFNEFARGDVE